MNSSKSSTLFHSAEWDTRSAGELNLSRMRVTLQYSTRGRHAKKLGWAKAEVKGDLYLINKTTNMEILEVI